MAAGLPQGALNDIERLITGNRIFKQRNVDIGVVTKDDCYAWGFYRRDDPRLWHSLGPAQATSPTSATTSSSSTFRWA